MCVSKPKVQALPPVVERQAYKDPVSRASLGGVDDDTRRRMIAGVMTSNLGVSGPASTTRTPGAAPATVQNTGGDQQILPVLSSGGATSAAAPINTASLIPAIVAQKAKRPTTAGSLYSPRDRVSGRRGMQAV